MMRIVRTIVVAFATLLATACSGGGAPPPTSAAEPLPAGPVGAEIALGRELLTQTKARMPGNVTARLNCSSCHVNAGTVARAGTLVGASARFPQWNGRSHRVIALQDRIAECFLYSMNGKPPAYASKEMIAIVAYIAWISRATPAFSTPDPQQQFRLDPPAPAPDTARGAQIYATKCASCHQSGGGGVALAIPPLWGAGAFNDGAGMARLGDMAGFVRYNMPQTAPGTLSEADAFAVAAYVLAHPRPKFAKDRPVSFPSRPAAYF